MGRQLTERQKAMRQAAFDYLHFLTDQEMRVERLVDRKLAELQPQIEQLIEDKLKKQQPP